MAFRRIGLCPRRRDIDFAVCRIIRFPTQFSVVEDAIRVLFCDFELNCERSEDLEEITLFLEDFKLFMMKTLEEEEIWIVFYPISRIIS